MSTCQEERCWEPPGHSGKGGLIQAVLIKPDNATELAWLSQERGKDGLGRRASLPPKSMSLLTWAEENLTALETCPSDEKEEAEKRLEPEKAPDAGAISCSSSGGKSALLCFYRSPRDMGAAAARPHTASPAGRNVPALR